jgi:hypothetical protein
MLWIPLEQLSNSIANRNNFIEFPEFQRLKFGIFIKNTEGVLFVVEKYPLSILGLFWN